MFKKYYSVLQRDETDCGPACVLTVAKQYKSNFSVAKLRDVMGTDKNGTNIVGILKGLEYSGFDSKAVKVEERKIDNSVSFPLIAHIQTKENLLHYVVVHNVTKKSIIISDPAIGIKKYTHEKFSEIWTGILILIDPKKNFEKRNENDNSLMRFFYVLKNQKSLLWNIFLTSMLYTFLGIISSFYFKFLVDYVLKDKLVTTLNILIIGVIILEIIKIFLSIFRGFLLMFLGQRIDVSILFGYYNHMIRLPMKFFSSRKAGEIISRFSDADNINDTVAETVLSLMLDVIMSVVGGIIVYFQNQYLFFISVVLLLLYTIIVFSFKGILKKVNREVLENNSQMTSLVIQSINGIETIKTYNLEKRIQDETEFKYLKVLKSSLRRTKIGIFLGTLSEIVELLGSMVFNTLLGYFTEPVKNLIGLQPTIQTAMVSADRLGEVIDLDIEQKDERIIPDNLKGDIEIKNLDFRYGTREQILKNINMKIKKGEKIALVGESGSGKTTLAKLFLKFFDFEKGEININDFNIKDIDITFLREKISYISQDIFLFNNTIKENLMLNETIKMEEVIEMAKKINAYDFINQLPQRFNYVIEENGANLSMGQKQRLSILRALLKKPDILIMDEATSNLDTITENIIQNTLNNLDMEMTIIIIAHRLSTIHMCDRIYVLDKGEIIESGTHEELVNMKGKYYRLLKEQERS